MDIVVTTASDEQFVVAWTADVSDRIRVIMATDYYDTTIKSIDIRKD